MKERWIIFDFDGTLVDSKALIIEIINELAKKYGRREITAIEFEEMITKINPLILIKYRIWPWQVIPLIREGRKMFKERSDEVVFFPGALNAIKKLKKKSYKLGVLTNNRSESVEKIFERVGIKDYFDFILSSESLRNKTNSLKKIISGLKIDKKDVVYVGDEVNDIKACKKIGVKVIAVSWGFIKKELLEAQNPDYVVNSFKELVNIL